MINDRSPIIFMITLILSLTGTSVTIAHQKPVVNKDVNQPVKLELNLKTNLKTFPLSINQINRSGVNKKIPTLDYNLKEIYNPVAAKGMEIYGLVEIEGKTHLFIKTEQTAPIAAVGVGDRLQIGDSQVLIKRVEKLKNSEPMVILEEEGLEVTRYLGEKSIVK